ncbi:unnamed protein product [Spirodela intermedia]|uniref:Pentatricopeptide repeat-containing protein n=1 Tax=Spirodela intermedia TaxID=51605 RepID=A0ABN7EA27_SPIIN|nr:unnamed protein product [Spirodela intermedia]
MRSLASSSSFKLCCSSSSLLIRHLSRSPPSHSGSSAPSHSGRRAPAGPPIAIAAGDHPQSPFDPQAVLETISCYANDWSRAIEFFRWVEDRGFRHNVETYNRVIDVLGKFFEFDLAWEIVCKMRSDPAAFPGHSTFRVLFKRYAAAHLVQEAVAAFDRAAEFGLRDQICFHHLVDALCEYRHVIDVEDLFLKKKDPPFPLDSKVYNMVLRGWYKMGWWKKCREFWDEMDQKGIRKDLHSYSIYMDILCKSGKPWRAVKLYKEMKRKGSPSTLYREMLEVGCRPNIVTHNIIIKLLCQSGRIREAFSFLHRMRKLGFEPNVISYHCFFQCMSRPREILELFDRMLGSGCRPAMDTYVMLMRKFGRWGFLRPVFVKGMVELARKYDQEMLDKGLSAKPRKEFGPRFGGEEAEDHPLGGAAAL